MGIYTLKVLWEFIEHFRNGFSLTATYLFGEFLINYQGGFVRRGLLGEIIYFCATQLGVSPKLFVGVFCAICVAVVVWFFIKQFKDNKICWWLLPLNFCLANMDVIRKDFFFVVSLIVILYCYKSQIQPLFKIVIINLVAVFTILTHEAFFFYCIPLLCWIIVKDNNLFNKTLFKLLICSPMIIAMLLASLFHGDIYISQTIANSWTEILHVDSSALIPPTPPEEDKFIYSGAIGALSWDAANTISFHSYLNFFQRSLGIPGYIIKIVTILVVFYFLLNYLTTFSFLSKNRIVSFTRILTIQFFSLLPLFTVLSCDTSRIYFYWLTSTFVFFFLLCPYIEQQVMPRWYQSTINRIHDFFTIKIKPPLWLLVLLLFTVSVPIIGNNLIYMWENNVIMQIYRLVNVGLKTILQYI